MSFVFTFRDEMRPGDAASVREILVSTGLFHAGEVDVAVELVEERLSRGPKSGYIFLFAEEGENMAGYVCFGPIALTENRFDIYWIAVRGDMRGRGLGTALLSEAEEVIRRMGGARVFVETSSRDSYRRTRGFYLKMGYSAASVVRDFYAEGDDKIIYLKCLFCDSPETHGNSGPEEKGGPLRLRKAFLPL